MFQQTYDATEPTLITKGVNTVLEVVLVWPTVRYISDTGIPFRIYHYIYSV